MARTARPQPSPERSSRRFDRGDLIALVGSIGLFVSLFLQWWSIEQPQRCYVGDRDVIVLGHFSAFGVAGVGWEQALALGVTGGAAVVAATLAAALVVVLVMATRIVVSRNLPMILCLLALMSALLAFFTAPKTPNSFLPCDGSILVSRSFGAVVGLVAVAAMVGGVVWASVRDARDGIPR